MGKNVTQKLIETHLVDGRIQPGEEIGLRIDQTLTQDATGTMVMLEFEAMQIPRVKTELSVQYVDHNLLQTDFKNADYHLFLLSACKKFGVWYSRPGNGVSHPVHMERFGMPGRTLLGSDSHTPAAGAQILPYRSNIPEISKYAFIRLDDSFYDRAVRHQQQGFIIVAGNNYGQGSSREHAAIAPRYLGLKAVIARSFARIHWQNLINFGMLPLTFVNSADYDRIEQGDALEIIDVRHILCEGNLIQVTNKTKNETYDTQHTLSKRQIEMILQGSLINVVRKRQKQA